MISGGFAGSNATKRFGTWHWRLLINLVVLKNSLFVKIAKILGVENVCQNRDRRLWGFLLQSFFDRVLVSEFFNSHTRLHALPNARLGKPRLGETGAKEHRS